MTKVGSGGRTRTADLVVMRDAEALVMSRRYMSGRSHQEIAVELGTDPLAVEWVALKGLIELKNKNASLLAEMETLPEDHAPLVAY